jgi:hypothetical protein
VLATDLIAKGWGVAHPLAGVRLTPGMVMLFGPRDADELEIVTGVVASHAWATGRTHDRRPSPSCNTITRDHHRPRHRALQVSAHQSVVTNTAVLDVSEDSVLFLSGLLHAERVRLGTRALSTHREAVLVVDDTRMNQLAGDNNIAVWTAYDYRDEAIAVLAARKPSLHAALLAAKAAGHTHVIVDGTLIGTDGIAKTHLAIALAVAACSAGYSIYFTSLDEAGPPTPRRRGRRPVRQEIPDPLLRCVPHTRFTCARVEKARLSIRQRGSMRSLAVGRERPACCSTRAIVERRLDRCRLCRPFLR